MSESARPDPIRDLLALPDAQERLGWIIDQGRRRQALSLQDRSAAQRVPGCVSAVWLLDESRDGVCRFRGDAEAPVLRGLVGLACDRASDRVAAEVAADASDLVTALQIERHLTPTRVNGLRQVQRHLRRLAAAHAGLAPPP